MSHNVDVVYYPVKGFQKKKFRPVVSNPLHLCASAEDSPRSKVPAMPNRILREGFLDSEPIRKAGELAEVLFTRLMLVADDFGRFDGRVTVICRRCWPNGGPTEVDVLERLSKLIEFGLVIAYETDGKPYLYLPKFRQRTRAESSKYPQPPVDNRDLDCPLSQAEIAQEKANGNKDISKMADIRVSNDSHQSDSRARSSYFEVRSSNSEHAHTRDPQTPRAAAHSIAKAQQVIAEQKTWQTSPMPESVRAHTRARENPLDSTAPSTEESKP